MVTAQDFLDDQEGRRYRQVVYSYWGAFQSVFAVLSDRQNVALMEADSRDGRPALYAVVRQLEEHVDVAEVLASEDKSQRDRFKQAVGVAVKLVMRHRRWDTTGRKGSLKGRSRWFVQAERYQRPRDDAAQRAMSFRALMDQLETIGDERERRCTGEELMTALAVSRSEEGRVF